MKFQIGDKVVIKPDAKFGIQGNPVAFFGYVGVVTLLPTGTNSDPFWKRCYGVNFGRKIFQRWVMYSDRACATHRLAGNLKKPYGQFVHGEDLELFDAEKTFQSIYKKFHKGDYVTPVSNDNTYFHGGFENYYGRIGIIVGWDVALERWKVNFEHDMKGIECFLHNCGGELPKRTGLDIAECDLKLADYKDQHKNELAADAKMEFLI